VASGHTAIVAWLLANGAAELPLRSRLLAAPHAAANGHLNVSILLASGADLHAKTTRERRRLVSRWSVAMPKSLNFCAATGLRKREARKMSVPSKVAVLTGFLLCLSTLSSGMLYSPATGGAMALHITSPEFSEEK